MHDLCMIKEEETFETEPIGHQEDLEDHKTKGYVNPAFDLSDELAQPEQKTSEPTVEIKGTIH